MWLHILLETFSIYYFEAKTDLKVTKIASKWADSLFYYVVNYCIIY